MYEHTNAVRDAPGLTPYAKLVMYALASRADEHGKAWPAFPQLMQDTAIKTREALYTAIRAAEAAGVLVVERKRGVGNRYALNVTGTRSEILPTQPTPRHPDQIGNPTYHQIGNPTSNQIGNPTPKRPLKKSLKKPLYNASLIPNSLDNDEFKKRWSAFIENRKHLKKPATDHAQELLLSKLAERPGQAAIAALKTAIERGWTGFEWEWLENTRNKRGDADEGLTEAQQRIADFCGRLYHERKADGTANEEPPPPPPLYPIRALMALECYDLDMATSAHYERWKPVENALEQKHPGLTAEDIQTRARNFKSHFPNQEITPAAFIEHWDRCAAGKEVMES